MKKKLIGSFCAVAIAAITFFATKTNAGENGIDLTSLVKINSASAECTTRHNVGGGKCLKSVDLCVGDPGNSACDFGW